MKEILTKMIVGNSIAVTEVKTFTYILPTTMCRSALRASIKFGWYDKEGGTGELTLRLDTGGDNVYSNKKTFPALFKEQQHEQTEIMMGEVIEWLEARGVEVTAEL